MKWDCEIIQDLIPSYVDEVCSDKSKAVVEEHTGECRACKMLLEQYRLTDFSADKLEERELNGLKKIQSRMKRQTVISWGLGILLLLLGWYTFLGFDYIPRIGYYLLMLVCMFGTYRTKGQTADGCMQVHKIDHLLTAGSAVTVIFSISVQYLALQQAIAGRSVLGVEPEKAGPFLAGMWGCCFVIQLVFYAVLWQRQRKLHIENRFGLCICITGMFMLFVYVQALHGLESVARAKQIFMQMSITVLLLGAAGALISYYLPKKSGGQKGA